MVTAMMNQTIKSAIMMVETVVCQLLIPSIAQNAPALVKKLVILESFLHQLEMVTAMMKQTMKSAITMVETVVHQQSIVINVQIVLYVVIFSRNHLPSFFAGNGLDQHRAATLHRRKKSDPG